MDRFIFVDKPTLIIDPIRAKKNIAMMARKATGQNIRFRPHFKTHQSGEIGEWFAEEGVQQITVSSVTMAEYFADLGWQDILIAFPTNIRQIEAIYNLARKIERLGLLVESVESLEFLGRRVASSVEIWIKVDTGNHRTGIPWDQLTEFEGILQAIKKFPQFNLRGILTHAGNTYQAASKDEIALIYQLSVTRMQAVRNQLARFWDKPLEISVGDTPGCSICADLGAVDEIRPGNFVFYDAEQLALGTCTADQIAVAVACPVVALHPQRNEVIIYGGAIHLSKDFYEKDGIRIYGLPALPGSNGWEEPLKGGYVSRLSQEHGVVHLEDEDLNKISIGDLLFIIPAHSCLTVQALPQYFSTDGEIITTMLTSANE